jgi:hypothetical protein
MGNAGAFFKSALNPTGNPFKGQGPMGAMMDPLQSEMNPMNGMLTLAGPNSSLDKWVAKLPGSTSGFTRTVSPQTYNAAETADNLNSPPKGYVAASAPFANAAPSLAGANASYTTPQATAATAPVLSNTANGPSMNFWNSAALKPGNTVALQQSLTADASGNQGGGAAGAAGNGYGYGWNLGGYGGNAGNVNGNNQGGNF